jgi:ubiquinol-cytochrome c reductase iron-sulfur subunit
LLWFKRFYLKLGFNPTKTRYSRTGRKVMSKDSEENKSRRDFLGTITAVVGGAGVAAGTWPIISSMNPSTDILAKSTTEVDLDGLEAGQAKTVSWQGKPVFVVHRTKKQIQAMADSQGGKQPQPDTERVQRSEWLILVGVCTHLGCVPNIKDDGWFCPCHGSVYDLSGRVLKGPAPRNLEVPPYQFVTENKIVIGKA